MGAERLWRRAMRILLVTETLALGGAETFVLRLARQLLHDGYQAELLCLNPDLDDPLMVAHFPDVPIHRVPVAGLRTLKRLDRMGQWFGLDLGLQQRRAARWVDRNLIGRFHVHHTNLFGADWLFTRVKRRHPAIKLVSTLHGDYSLYDARVSGTEQTRIWNWRAKLAETLRAVDRWVTISPDQHRQFVEQFKVDPARLADIPNGYAPASPLASGIARDPDGRSTTFVMVARGIQEKGWSFLIDAFRRLDGDRRLVLVGQGAYLEALRAAHGDDPQILFAGVHHNPIELITAGDVFVHPSIYPAESMPTVIVEALFARRPVIATDVGSVASMIATPMGDRAGILLAPDDATLEDDLVAAMQSYIDDPSLRRAHAALAEAAFTKFDMAKCAAAYARLYAEVVG